MVHLYIKVQTRIGKSHGCTGVPSTRGSFCCDTVSFVKCKGLERLYFTEQLQIRKKCENSTPAKCEKSVEKVWEKCKKKSVGNVWKSVEKV